jgi:hypothetical protein
LLNVSALDLTGVFWPVHGLSACWSLSVKVLSVQDTSRMVDSAHSMSPLPSWASMV